MSESVKSWGSLREDDGNRVVEAGASSSSSTSERKLLDDADGGAWRESVGLDVFGDPFELPGMGESGARCGEFFPSGVCEDPGHLHFGAHRCGRRSCPDCYGLWARDAATRGTVRIQMKRDTEPNDWRRQAAHVVASPPEGEIRSVRQYWNGYRDAADLAKQKGMRGFAVIGHPFRLTEDAKEMYREANEVEEVPVGAWVWVRDHHAEDFYDLVYWSPHYHILGLTSKDMEPGGGDEDDEWVWHFVRSFSRYGRYDEEAHEDVYGTFRYLLSHTGWPPDSTKQVVRWYGSLSTNSFTEDERPSESAQDAIRRRVEEIAGGDAGEDEDAPAASEDEERCDIDGCSSCVIPVKEIPHYLTYNEPPREVGRRMELAFEWFAGYIAPPDGLKSPRTREDAMEAFEVMRHGVE